VETTEDDEAERALLFGDGGGLGCGGFSWLALDATELFGIGEDDIHVLVES